MSDHWEFFPCQMGENKAFIFYDHGIKDRINEMDLPVSARISVPFRAPREDGLPTDDEFDALTTLEDELAREIAKLGGAYVGRISVDGERYFYTYVDATAAQMDALAAKLTVTTGYPAKAAVTEDPEKGAYWNSLYPTRDDWRLIQDLRVIEKLQEEGDALDKTRKVDHLAYFDTMRGADKFKAWLEAEGFNVDWVSKPEADEDLLGISFSHVCRPILGDVTHHTHKLFNKVEELGGKYNGWGTTVEAELN